MHRLISIVILSLFFNFANGQGYFDQWYFGNGAGIQFIGDSVAVNNNGSLNTQEGCASVCDYQGNLLFYTDGDTVWNKFHNPMPNGFGLMGHFSSSQTALIVRVPQDSSRYYVFTLQEHLANGNLRYSIVDMQLDFGNGDVVPQSKNTFLGTNFTEKLVAAKGNCGVWVLTHKKESAEFYAYLVKADGIEAPIISKVGSKHPGSGNPNGLTGTMKVSPDNQRIALATLSGIVELFDFNFVTGVVSKKRCLTVTPDASPWGVCFSPNSKRLYVGEGFLGEPTEREVYQFDISSGKKSQINDSKTLLGKPQATESIVFDIQIGPNDKIYLSRNRTRFLDAINDPDQLGTACDYETDAVDLGSPICTIGLPNSLKFAFSADTIISPLDECEVILEMPNVFSPNNDGVNDLFIPVDSRGIASMQTFIYDRWGKLVFQTNNPSINWDGKSANEGTYYWGVEYTGRNGLKDSKSGYLVLLK